MRVQDHIIFTAKHREWKVGEKIISMDNNERIAHFLARVSNTVVERIPSYLTGVMNVAGIMSLAEDIAGGDLIQAVVKLKSPSTSKKLGQMVFEEDRKLRKLLLDVARAVLVREVLSKFEGISYPGGVINELEIVLPYTTDHVNFTAKHGRWVVVKRLVIDDATPNVDVARLLASINETVTAKLPVYAGIDIEGIASVFAGFKKVRKSEVPLVMERYLQFQPVPYAPKSFERHARVYALQKAIETIGLPFHVPAKSLEKYLEKK